MHRNFFAESSSTMFGMEDRQEMINRNSFCLSQLRRASEHSNSLRRENDVLRSMNVELGKKLRVLIQSTLHQNRLDPRDSERFALPKSISVKTDEYVKTENSHRSRTKSKSRTDNAFHIIKEKVYVKRGKSEERTAVEIEVKRQGSTKTELCQKWQQTGECPYGKLCRFAHGVSELRPVIRHPRYKSQICRMVLAGLSCPYGHRCHFLHSAAAAE